MASSSSSINNSARAAPKGGARAPPNIEVAFELEAQGNEAGTESLAEPTVEVLSKEESQHLGIDSKAADISRMSKT